MNILIQKSQSPYFKITLEKLSSNDIIQINIDDEHRKCTFYIKIEQLKSLLLKSDCFKLISK